jgi:Family of unknown function (DUF6510)
MDDDNDHDDHVDGNAIAGLLLDVFGTEMTTATGVCAGCGTTGQVGQAWVYLRAPGTVVRCPACLSILMVFVTIRGLTCVDLMGLRQLAAAPTTFLQSNCGP